MYSLKEKDEVLLALKPDKRGDYYFNANDLKKYAVLKQLREEGCVTTKPHLGDFLKVEFTKDGHKILSEGGFQAIEQKRQSSIQQSESKQQLELEQIRLQIETLKMLPGDNKKTRQLSLVAIAIALLSVILGTCNVHF